MRALIVGPDRGLEAALTDRGVSTTRIDGIATRDALDAAGIDEVALLVLTDVEEATIVSVAKERVPDLRVVVYAPDSLPDFVSRQVDLAVAPDVLSPAVVAEELVGNEQ